jgi:hypothetical protein
MIVSDIDENYKTGYIAIYRSLRNHWIWDDPVKLKWWLDILLEVNHAPRDIPVKYELIACDRGQSVKSLETWSKRWRVDKSTVNRFLKLLQKDKMILLENLKITTRITVCNYDTYNNIRNTKETQKKRHATQSETARNTNNNDNNDNNDNNVLAAPEKERYDNFNKWLKENAGRVTQMQNQITGKQFLNLFATYPREVITDTLIKMHNHKPLLSKNVDAYLTVINWINRDAKK